MARLFWSKAWPLEGRDVYFLHLHVTHEPSHSRWGALCIVDQETPPPPPPPLLFFLPAGMLSSFFETVGMECYVHCQHDCLRTICHNAEDVQLVALVPGRSGACQTCHHPAYTFLPVTMKDAMGKHPASQHQQHCTDDLQQRPLERQ